MISNCRQFMYRCDPTGKIASRIFGKGENIPNGWHDSPKAAKAKPYTLVLPNKPKLVLPNV